MHIEYVCKHCHHFVGELNQPNWTYAQVEQYCGLQQLTPLERLEAVSYQDSGSIRVQTVCQHCQRALETNPELLVEGKLLQ